MIGKLRVVLVVLAVLAASCSGGDDAAGTTTSTASDGSGDGGATTTTVTDTTDATSATTTTSGGSSVLPSDCLLLTTDDLMAATGLAFGEGAVNEDLSSDTQIICDWVTEEASDFAIAQVLIAEYGYEDAKAGTAGVYTLVDVSIPGASQAYATEEGSLIGMEIDGLYVQVAYIPSGPGSVLDETTALATAAAARFVG